MNELSYFKRLCLKAVKLCCGVPVYLSVTGEAPLGLKSVHCVYLSKEKRNLLRRRKSTHFLGLISYLE